MIEVSNVKIEMGKLDKGHKEAIIAVAEAFKAHSQALEVLAKSVEINLGESTGMRVSGGQDD